MLCRSRPCQRSLALRRLPYSRTTSSVPRCMKVRYAASQAFAATADAQQTWRRRSPHEASPQGRGFATAVDDFRIDGLPKISYPIFPPQSPPGLRPFDLRPVDANSILNLPEIMQPRIPRMKTNRLGISGDLEEMLSAVDACLRVGKLERAGLVLKRISGDALQMIDRSDIMTLHNLYLQVAVDQLAEDPSKEKAEHIFAWYETEIRRPGLPETPETAAYVLKAALLCNSYSTSANLNRLVGRYMDTAGDYGLEVLYMTDILTDKDRATITKLCSKFNLPTDDFEAPEEPQEETMPAEPETAEIASTPTQTFPGVRPTPQKGVGLATVQQTLSVFREIPEGRDIRELTLDQRKEIQSRLEKDSIDAAIERWRQDHELMQRTGVNSTSAPTLNSRLYEWQLALEARLEQEFKDVEASEAAEYKTPLDLERCKYGPCLRLSTPQRLAALTILGVFSTVSINGADKGLPVLQAVTSLATHAEQDAFLANKFTGRKAKPMTSRMRRFYFNQGKTAAAGSTMAAESSAAAGSTAADTFDPERFKLTPGTAAAHTFNELAAGSDVVDGFVAENPLEGVEAAIAAEAASLAKKAAKKAAKRAAPLGKKASTAAEPENKNSVRLDGIFTAGSDVPQIWPSTLRAQIGAILLEHFIDCAQIEVFQRNPDPNQEPFSQIQPAFMRQIHYNRGKKVGILMPSKALIEIMMKEPRGEFLARHLPMVCEPAPWKGFLNGGYLESPTPLIRLKLGEKDQRIYTEAAIARGDMDQIAKGLDALGRTAWKINKPVLEVMLEIWNTGEALAGVPPLEPDLPLPEEPESTDDPMARARWMRDLKAVENLRSSMHSQRCFMNFQLEIARAFRDQTFHYPHNIDFRGRAYPIPAYLNHMGADHARGLLMFAKGKELGPYGLRWLKIHLANVYGFDKASLSERATFTDENMDNIMDSANNPLTGQRWWLKAEDPWQCLATCMELKGAMESAEPSKFVSHMPVHQDGTCNGLQHYAALGGDVWGAQQVNLVPGDRPADVYSAVADLVKEAIAQDVELGVRLARPLVGKITRKVVKQTVMTNVYGVTFVGAKEQVRKQLDALYPNLEKETGIESFYFASYIAVKIFKALSTMFSGAHDIQNWLGECGGRVCRAITPETLERLAEDMKVKDEEGEENVGKVVEKAAAGVPAPTLTRSTERADLNPETEAEIKTIRKDFNQVAATELAVQFRSTIIWTTPLRMPVVQPYRKANTKVIQTSLQTLLLKSPEAWDPVMRRKQLQAFPPNFIHSLDASHMMLSALECDSIGLTFAAVHDSFWTHAADVHKMNEVLRDAFIRVHSDDVIARLADEFRARYEGSIYMVSVIAGTEVEKAVSKWRASAKLSLSDELLLEKRRMDLLASEDPAERARGEAMETPGSIYSKLAPDEAEAVTAPEDEATPLSAVPESAEKQVSAMTDSKAVAKDAEVEVEADADGLSATPVVEEALHPIEAADEDAVVEKDSDEYASTTGVSHFSRVMDSQAPAPRKRLAAPQKRVIVIWAPLTFPDIPKKGEFNVKDLKGSDYFFS